MRSFFFKTFSVFLGFFIAIILSEIFFVLYYLVEDKDYYSVKEKLDQEANLFFNKTMEDKNCSYAATLGPHPYLAFIHRSLPSCNFKVNNAGHYGKDFPLEKTEDKFVIMITGGSVATQLGRMTTNSLEELLNKSYQIENKEFVVLNGSLEAWKQPQQLINLALYGNVIDGLITLEGFNEVVFSSHAEYKQKLEKPWESSYVAANPTFSSEAFILATWANDKIYKITQNHWLLGNSKLFYFLSKTLRSIIRNSVDTNDNNRLSEINKIFDLPAEWSLEKRRNFHIDEYRKYVLIMNAISNQLNIKFAFFIQPVPAIGKKLTQEELKSAGNLSSYKNDYLLMESNLLSLRNKDVPIFSLTNIYSDYEETLYIDPVHQKENSEGYVIMAKHIIEILEREWGLQKREIK